MSTLKYNYVCLNAECEHRNIQVVEKPEEDETNPEPCLYCEGDMKLLGYSPSGGFLRTQSMTPQQRKQVLLSRSKQHYQDVIKDKKHEMLKASFGKGLN